VLFLWKFQDLPCGRSVSAAINRNVDDLVRGRIFIMCGRYSLVCIDDLGNRFRVHDPMLGLRSRFNVAPSQVMPVIVQREKAEMNPMQWGLIPSDTQSSAADIRPINARIETLAENPLFRNLLAHRRCLVPASGFYEWKREGHRKIPFYVHFRERSLFAFAGLYAVCRDAQGKEQYTYAIITTKASGGMARIHERMPVILDFGDEEEWLNSTTLTPGDLDRFLSTTISDEMEIYPVSGRVNDPKHDDSSLIRPVNGLGM
jgi:putative SOS response-associated peptidase YedK